MIIAPLSPVNASPSDWTINGDFTVVGSASISGSTSIQGDLYVYGDHYDIGQTYITDAETIVGYISGSGHIGAVSQYTGLRVDRGSLTDYRIVFDEVDDYFKIGEIGSEQIVQTKEGATTQGKVAFGSANDSLTEDSLFHFDSTNDRLGIGIASPTERLQVYEASTASVKGWVGNTGGSISLEAISGSGDAKINATGALTMYNANGLFLETESGAGKIGLGGNYNATYNVYLHGAVGTSSSLTVTNDVTLTDGRLIVTSANGSNFKRTGALDANPILEFYNDSGEVARITRSGNLGIGASAPNFKLHIHEATGGADAVMQFTTNATTSAVGSGTILFVDDTDKSFNILNKESAPISFFTAGTTQMTLDGIGGLNLIGNSTEDEYLKVGVGRSGSGNAYLDLVGDATYTTYGLRIIRGNSGANSNSYIYNRGTGSLNIVAEDAGTINISTNATPRITIDSAGVISFNTLNLTAVGDPINAQDAATKNYVDSNFFNASGTPLDNQIAIFTDATTVEGDANFTWDGTTFQVKNTANTLSAILNTSGKMLITQTTGTLPCFATRTIASTQDRFYVNAFGSMYWGTGTAETDVIFYRSAEGILKSSDTLEADTFNIVSSATKIDVNAGVMQFTDATNGAVTLTQIANAVDNYVDVNGDTYLGTLSVDSTQATIDATSAITSVQPADEVLVRDASDSNFLKTVAFSDLGKYTNTNVGDGSNTVYTITHNLGTKDVLVVVRDNGTDDLVQVATVATTTNSVTLTFTTIPTASQYTVKVIS